MEANANRGMTLVEVLVALLILFVTTLVTVQTLSGILRLETQGRYMSEAIPRISTLVYEQAAGAGPEPAALEFPGWILERRNEVDEKEEPLFYLYPEDQQSVRIPLVF